MRLLGEFQALEGLTVEQTEAVNALTSEANGINAQIEAKQGMEAVMNLSTKVEAKTVTKTFCCYSGNS